MNVVVKRKRAAIGQCRRFLSNVYRVLPSFCGLTILTLNYLGNKNSVKTIVVYCHIVFMGLTGFDWVLLGFTVFDRVSMASNRFSLGFT